MKILISYIVVFIPSLIFAQYVESESVRFDKDLDFIDGIYLTWEEFKNNSPTITDSNIIYDSSRNGGRLEDCNKYNGFKQFKYYDNDSNIVIVKSKNIWGYCLNKKVYKGGYRVFIIGAICYYATTQQEYAGIMGANGMMTSGGHAKEYSTYLMSFKTGEVFKNTVVNFAKMMREDGALYDEFSRIKGDRKKKQMVFRYLLKFNDRNPIYLENSTK